jgi:hypothetical protein
VEEKPARRYPREFRLMAEEGMKSCDNMGALGQELGVPRRRRYKWRDRQVPVEPGEESALQQSPRESRLRTQVHRLKRVLAEKTLEVDFFKGALQKVEARRRRSSNSGEPTSTTKSGK